MQVGQLQRLAEPGPGGRVRASTGPQVPQRDRRAVRRGRIPWAESGWPGGERVQAAATVGVAREPPVQLRQRHRDRLRNRSHLLHRDQYKVPEKVDLNFCSCVHCFFSSILMILCQILLRYPLAIWLLKIHLQGVSEHCYIRRQYR